MSADRLDDLEGGLAEFLTFIEVPEGPWDPVRGVAPFEGAFALLVVRGLLLADLRLDRGGATEILGPGDLFRAWPTDSELLPFTSAIVVAEGARVAVLDASFVDVLRRWPAVGARLVLQSAVRHRRQAQHRAASQLPRVEDRLLALLWLMAERWGRVGSGGVIVPLALTHELLGRLVGARRPTVTMAIGQLVEDGAIRRRPDRSVVLMPASRRALAPGDAPLSKVIDAELVELVGPAKGSDAVVRRRVRAPEDSMATRLELQHRRVERLRADHQRALERAVALTEQTNRTLERARTRRSRSLGQR